MQAVFQSSEQSFQRYIDKILTKESEPKFALHPPFPLICDPDERLYKLYGVTQSFKGQWLDIFKHAKKLRQARKFGIRSTHGMEGTVICMPADFLINEQGIIEEAFYATTGGEHIPFQIVDRFISRIKNAELTV